MSLMEQIKRAWDDAVRAVNGHHSYDDIPASSLAEEFMTRLKRIPTGIDIILTNLYSKYAGSRSKLDEKLYDYDKLQDQCIGYQRERNQLREECNKLKTENMTIIAKGTKTINECHVQIEALESSLNTSRFFIFMSGMCGFVLGLACLYLVV
jgi:hypothetical protein